MNSNGNSQVKGSIMKTELTLILVLMFLGMLGCQNLDDRGINVNPPTKEGVTLKECVKPPPQHYTQEIQAQLDASIPRLEIIAKADVGVIRKAVEIRKVLPGLQTFEVLDYRFCVMNRNGVINDDQYLELVKESLILLKDSVSQGSDLVAEFELHDNAILTIGNVGDGTYVMKDLTIHWEYEKCGKIVPHHPFKMVHIDPYKFNATLTTSSSSHLLDKSTSRYEYPQNKLDVFEIKLTCPEVGIYQIWLSFKFKKWGSDVWSEHKTEAKAYTHCEGQERPML